MSEQVISGEIAEAAVQPVIEQDHSQTAVEQKEELVPVSALQAERRQRQELQEHYKMLQDHLELVRANKVQAEPVPDTSNDDDILTIGEAKKYINQLQHKYDMSVSEMKIQQQYPDYSETVRKFLPDVLKENPELRDDIKSAKNPYKLAYVLAKKSDGYKQANMQDSKNDTAERILKNSQRAGTVSSVGQTSPQNSSKSWKSMSDSEFMKHVKSNMGYF